MIRVRNAYRRWIRNRPKARCETCGRLSAALFRKSHWDFRWQQSLFCSYLCRKNHIPF